MNIQKSSRSADNEPPIGLTEIARSDSRVPNRIRLTAVLLLRVCLIALSIGVFSQSFFAAWQVLPTAAMALLGAILAFSHPGVAVGFICCLLCSAPLLGGAALNLILSCWLLGATARDTLRGAACVELTPQEAIAQSALLLFAVLFAGAALPVFFYNSDYLLLFANWEHGGVKSLLKVFAAWYAKVEGGSKEILNYTLALLFFSQLCRWRHTAHISQATRIGLSAGATIASIVFLFQYFDLHPVFSSTRSAFWLFTGRYSASFSDPNAFGLMVGLLGPFLLFGSAAKRRPLAGIAGCALLLAGLWAASRTYWLCVGFWALWAMFKAMRLRGRAAALFLVSVVVLLVLAGIPAFNERLQALFPLPGLHRVLLSLHWEHALGMLESRLIFWNLAFHAGMQAPLGGLGLGQFYAAQENVAQLIGLELGQWRDNANSFYLQVFAEAGVLGLTIALLSLGLLAFSLRTHGVQSTDGAETGDAGEGPVAKIQLGLLLLLLVVGPHLAFDEVRYLSIIFLALAVQGSVLKRPTLVLRAKRVVWACAALIPVFYSFHYFQGSPVLRGVYAAENGDSGRYYWTVDSVSFAFCERGAGPQTFLISAPRPDLGAQGLRVVIRRYQQGRYVDIDEVVLRSTAPVSISLPPSPEPSLPEYLQLQIDRLWQPVNNSAEGDSRWLGVQLHWQEGMCERIAAAR